MTIARETPEPAAGQQEELPVEQLLELFERMAVIRATEKAAYDLFMSGVVKGTTHLASGQEAVAVGASAALRPDDYVFATYRGHHHAIARGAAPEACLAELMSRATGLCGAKGGSMHLTVASGNMLGSYAIVGAHLPIACGAAWSAKLRGTDQVAVAFFGDGATNIGAFHEALNLAAVWQLPVLFVCENNLYMEYTPIRTVTAVDQPAAGRAPAYGLPAEVVDGNDVVAVRGVVAAAAARARAGDGPTVIEALTYRHYGHSRADPAKYRPQEEVDAWLRRDPLDLLADRLRARGVEDQAVEERRGRAQQLVAAAVEAAKAAPPPDPAAAFTDVWADGGAQWRT
jgi:acetoin:2,6-dichlorophenolindophenol oxidoreductase subunit alpha